MSVPVTAGYRRPEAGLCQSKDCIDSWWETKVNFQSWVMMGSVNAGCRAMILDFRYLRKDFFLLFIYG